MGFLKTEDSRRAISKSELAGFQKTLATRQAELELGNRSREALAIESSPDELDRIQHGQERDLAMRTLARDSKRLREVRDALGRIESGTFGICAECATQIGLKRLAAVPWTNSCIVCQEAADNSARQPWNASEELLVRAA